MKIAVYRGSALLIVLAFVVIVSVVLLAYLARTQQALQLSESSTTLMKTDWLARTAEAALLSDIRQEMLAGSSGTSLPGTNQPMTITNFWAMKPGRALSSGVSGADTNFVNLVKQSVSGKPFYPGSNPPATYTAKGSDVPATGNTRASGVNTSSPSKNERLISVARWNKPALLRGGGFTDTNQLPDWVLITRAGVSADGSTPPADYQKKAPANTDFVIGRFAYNIYDIGGLLDVNVAGYDPSDPATTTNAATKGSTAWADLTAIPGVNDPKELVAWRNKASKSDYLAMIRGRQLGQGADPFADIQPWGEPRGFLEPFQNGGAADNKFFSRQELLKFQQTYGNAILATNALPFLTTFSADLDQPSHAPHPDRPKIQRSASDGGNDAYQNDDAINPNFLTVIGTDGEPLVRRRFPLDRLKYVVPNPPESAKVAQYFGLQWDDPQYAWTYPDGNRIKRLSEVSGREPNFIELLKAAITAGSLGGQFQNRFTPENANSPRILGQRDGSVDNHIIQIAANIIDQYDSDSYPTRIVLNGRTFYGTEDLPYLYVFRRAIYRTGQVTEAEFTGASHPPDALSLPYRSVMFVQTTLWNPHAANTESPPTAVPQTIRITADSFNGSVAQVLSDHPWWLPADPINNYPSSNIEDSPRTTPFSPASDFITFSITSTGPASFREPYTITSPGYPAGSGATGAVTKTILANQELNEASDGTTPTTEVTGIWAGPLWTGPYAKTSGDAATYFQMDLLVTDGMTFEMQCAVPDHGYVTYQSVEALRWAGSGFHDVDSEVSANGRPALRYVALVDPRTDRFGVSEGNNYVPVTKMQNGSALSDTQRRWLQGWTSWNNYVPAHASLLYGHFGTGLASNPGGPSAVNWTYASASSYRNTISRNKKNDDVHYEDPDGVHRLAMGGDNPSDGSGLPTSSNGLPTITGNTDSRPIILNRPFRSVVELGYAFRGIPWKQLDFWTPESGDAALLDVFCVHEPADEAADPVVAGRVNLNTGNSEVLQALLRGVGKTEGTSNSLTDTEAKEIADALVAWTSGTNAGLGPLKNRSELVGRYDPTVIGANEEKFAGFSTNISNLLGGADAVIQKRRQNILRALVDSGSTRTWTFLIDLIVQEGRYPENATSLEQFLVKGEQRYWIQVSLDRFTGKIVSRYVETVDE